MARHFYLQRNVHSSRDSTADSSKANLITSVYKLGTQGPDIQKKAEGQRAKGFPGRPTALSHCGNPCTATPNSSLLQHLDESFAPEWSTFRSVWGNRGFGLFFFNRHL